MIWERVHILPGKESKVIDPLVRGPRFLMSMCRYVQRKCNEATNLNDLRLSGFRCLATNPTAEFDSLTGNLAVYHKY